MIGIVKKIDAQGLELLMADGSKVPFILSDVMNRHGLEPADKKVVFSVVESRTRRLPRTS